MTAEPDLVDTAKTDVSTTINQTQIDNLPINGRNYINFSLLDSQVAAIRHAVNRRGANERSEYWRPARAVE